MKASAAGIPWYTRNNYNRILEVMEDRHALPPTYDQWLHRAEAVFEKLKDNGFAVYRVDIDPDSFVAWCRARGLNVDSNARTEFANEHADFLTRQKH